MRSVSTFGLLVVVAGLLVTNISAAQWTPSIAYGHSEMAFRPPPAAKVFPDYQQLFGYIASATGLGKSDDAELAQRLNSSSSIDHIHDYSGTGTGYMLLGQMEGRSYEWSIPNRHLQFLVSATTQDHRTTSDRYEVNQVYLVNLTELAKSEKHHERVVIDLRHATVRVF
jgi:hypothetical protein